jgi:hypothetical protein
LHGRRAQPGRGDRRRKKRLAARAKWDNEVGYAYLAGIRKSGREIDPDDLPPAMDWEADIWRLYERIRTQWRTGMNGATGLDYNPAIAIIQSKRWRLELALELLQVVELGLLAGRKED